MAHPNLFCILARESTSAVVFRRGPSKHVQLLFWDRNSDHIESGQWLKGRIYERRGDLSPSGNYLIYFAANHKPPMYSWTAVSKPPYMSALSLWENGSTTGGGGLFIDEFHIAVNGPCQSIQEKAPLPKSLKISQVDLDSKYLNVSGLGIYRVRLKRDGWTFTEESRDHFSCFRKYDSMRLEMQETCGNIESQGRWHETLYRLIDEDGRELLLELLDWADFDHNGDLLVANKGLIYRIEKKSLSEKIDLENASPIISLSENRFEAIETPTEYKKWSRH